MLTEVQSFSFTLSFELIEVPSILRFNKLPDVAYKDRRKDSEGLIAGPFKVFQGRACRPVPREGDFSRMVTGPCTFNIHHRPLPSSYPPINAMHFRNSSIPFLRSSNQTTTDLPPVAQPRRNPKHPASRRSAPTCLPPALAYPEPTLSLVHHLKIELFPADHPADAVASPVTADSPGSAYDVAIARLDAFVANSTLTAHQKVLLDASMTNAERCFVAPGEVHSLLHTTRCLQPRVSNSRSGQCNCSRNQSLYRPVLPGRRTLRRIRGVQWVLLGLG